MDWSFLVVLVPAGAFILWRSQKQAEAAKVASDQRKRDRRLYDHIKAGIREYHWRNREGQFWRAEGGALLFETAHLSAFHVNHFAEFRVGFCFKDIDEFGLYGFFAGNGDEFSVS